MKSFQDRCAAEIDEDENEIQDSFGEEFKILS